MKLYANFMHLGCQFATKYLSLLSIVNFMIKGGKVISVTNYAKLHGLTRQAIIKRLKNNKTLPGVKYCYKSGGKTSHYILVME